MTINQKLNNNSKISNEIIIFANKLADISEEIIAKYFRNKDINIIEKPDQSPVTIADTEVESALRAEIEKKYPEHGIVGEEFDEVRGISNLKWYIDPIDGTSAFISGKPTFTTIIALVSDGEPIYGLINQPITGERWQGGEIYQTNFNGQNVKTRKIEKLKDAVFATTSPYFFDERQLEIFNNIREKTKYQKHGGVFFGGDAYLYAMLASGNIDIVMEAGLKPHDFLPLIPIIKSAGGVITDWQGNEVTEDSNGEILACGSKEIHQTILRLIENKLN